MHSKKLYQKRNTLKLIASIAVFFALALTMKDQSNLLIEEPSLLPLGLLGIAAVFIFLSIVKR